MDMDLLIEKLLGDETIQDIPTEFVFRIALSFLSILDSGECFYKHSFD